MARKDPPAEVSLITGELRKFFNQIAPNGQPIGRAKCAVYAFFDYDGEPIYIGQTVESLSTRIGRHLTGRRSDAVAKFVLDPFEVLEIEVWPLWDATTFPASDKRALVDAAEFTVFQQALGKSRFGAVLNEGVIPEKAAIELPPSYHSRIVPEPLYSERKHPDIRIARRSQTVASLARLISERAVDKGLRRVLLTQTKRLEYLAGQRYSDFADEPLPLDSEQNDES